MQKRSEEYLEQLWCGYRMLALLVISALMTDDHDNDGAGDGVGDGYGGGNGDDDDVVNDGDDVNG